MVRALSLIRDLTVGAKQIGVGDLGMKRSFTSFMSALMAASVALFVNYQDWLTWE
jgi:hypothetical protein